MKIKSFGISLVVVALLSFSGCGEDEDASQSSSESVSTLFPVYTNEDLSVDVNGTINETLEHTNEVYKFTLSKAGKYVFNLKMLDGTTDDYYENIWTIIYDQDGNELLKMDVSSVDAANDFYSDTEFDVLSAGDIYVKVGRDSNLPTKYTLHIYPSVQNGLIQDEITFEPNGAKSIAKKVTLENTIKKVESSLNIVDRLDIEDWYVLDCNKTGKYSFNLQMLDGTTNDYHENIVVNIYNEEKTQLLGLDVGSVDAPNDFYSDTEFDVLTSGKVYIRIQRYSALPTKYAFHMYPSVQNGLIQDAMTFEPNGVVSSAKEITLSQAESNVTSDINIENMDVRDWYKLPITQTGKYKLNLTLLDGSVNDYYENIWVQIIDEDKREILIADYSSVDAPGDTYTDMEFDVNREGNIYIRIERDSNLASKYSFNITAVN